MLSRSKVIRLRLRTFCAFRMPSFNVPPTNPPTSLRASCLSLGSARYSSVVSLPTLGVLKSSRNFSQVTAFSFQSLLFRLRAVLILLIEVSIESSSFKYQSLCPRYRKGKNIAQRVHSEAFVCFHDYFIVYMENRL